LSTRHIGVELPDARPIMAKHDVIHVTGSTYRIALLSEENHRSVLNILDSLLANQIPAKGVVTIVCRIEIRKMAEC